VAPEVLEREVLDILREVAGTDQVVRDPDLPLYASGLLDSLATVTLMAALEERLGVSVSPAEFDPTAWATPRQLLADVARRLQAQGA
jgi:D-alanine--poly(phosphoribitol) ligase subunit 2